MSGQATDAAERSAHVTRGGDPRGALSDRPSSIIETVENGVLTARLRRVAELEAEVEELRAALEAAAALARAL